jgi:hypothetical protein
VQLYSHQIDDAPPGLRSQLTASLLWRSTHDPDSTTRNTYAMRYPIHITALCAASVSALQLPDLQPFLSAIPISISDYLQPTTDRVQPQGEHLTSEKKPSQQQTQHNLFRRQTDDTCPSSYNNCANIGAPGLCCSPSARCSADAAGHVACCPRGAACTGTIGAIITGGSTGSGTTTATETGNSGLLVTASTTRSTMSTDDGNGGVRTDGGFVLDGTQTVATPGAGFRGARPVSDFEYSQ